jgi:hypothetical protein
MSPQTSLPPQIPKQSLAPLLIGVAGVLVAGALGWMLLAGSTPEATEPPAAAAAAVPAASVRGPAPEPPPPPPEEELAPAPPPRAAPGGPKAAKAELSPQAAAVERDPNCDDPCRGKETPALLSALAAKAGQARSCYEKALSNDAALAGKLEVGVRVSPTGEACSAKVGKDTLADAAVTSCVLQRFRAGKYPKPTGGCVTVSVPMNFMPAGSR